MGQISAKEVVLVKFPFSDLSKVKLRPCLVLGIAEFGDLIVCQITSKSYSSLTAIPLADSDFSSGGLDRISFIRPDKIATLEVALAEIALGRISDAKYDEVNSSLAMLFQISPKHLLG